MSKSKGSPRKFSEKIALLNKKGAEGTAAFEQIIKEVEETTRASFSYSSQASSISSWIDDRTCTAEELQLHQQQHLAGNNFGQYASTGAAGSPSAPLHVQQPPLLHPLRPDHQVSIETPEGLPNIEIFPISDDGYTSSQQQAVNNSNATTTSYRNVCSNPISAARSLPDIANLRVLSTSPSLTFNPIAPSFSDQRIANQFDYSYDANCNIVSDTGAQPAQEQPYYSPHATSNQQASPTSANSWHIATYTNQHSQEQTHPLSSPAAQASSLHQDYYQPHSPSSTMVRASSTNTVWDDTSNTLNAPMLGSNRSKSSEGCYGYLVDHLHTSTDCCSNSLLNDQQQVSIPPMMRSRSYNNIENIDIHQDNKASPHRYLHQVQQQAFDDQCQFYQ